MVRLKLESGYLVVDLGSPRLIATTAHPKGLVTASKVAIVHVDKDADLSRPDDFKASVRGKLDLSEDDPVMLTAVDVNRYREAVEGDYGVLATVGLANAACHGMEATYRPLTASTINIVAWVPDRLTVSAILDLFRVVAETKAAAVADLMLRCDGGRATGTVSDAIAVAAVPSNNGYLWAGQATTVGSKVAALTYRALTAESPSVDDELRWGLGVSLEELLDDAIKLYQAAPVPGLNSLEAREIIRRELEKILRDPNVWPFIIAARESDLRGQSGLIPGLSRDEFEADSKRIIADELLATALSVYINGFRALTATYWADTLKGRLGLKLSALPMFEDDIAAALVASALSRVYDRLLGVGSV
ncbi:adenosylcobinamide amidohydrolase [Acidilobus sp. 7A]|uniref:adenosylcobinamide amidohydrolase n=1 Tax=Acidilobus sp. 7A TaxID=1577685 RepID=UPI000E3CB46A|nr:adenosylcobinamide amidohydrolase [Acidilobus sp. 7A]